MICLVAVKLGVGGIGVGAAVALHSATCFGRGRYHNGNAYPPINLTAILALNGWLPQARIGHFLAADEREGIRNWLNEVMQF
ncbi:hypothetical protein SASPL_107964 [Salvia splendens]|uniref:Uncharacterized protein n=1 Tax=Salvia splendens TaxID=180675 RepID=A0A8X8YFU9_SALSN|nr:hypothetical protein SASPL_107964 [Salvia splendens]